MYNFGDLVLTTFCTVRFLMVFHGQSLTAVIFCVIPRSLGSCFRIKHRKFFTGGLQCAGVLSCTDDPSTNLGQPHHYLAEPAETLEKQLFSGSGGVRQLSHCKHCPHSWGILHLLRYKCNGFRWSRGKMWGKKANINLSKTNSQKDWSLQEEP